MEVRGGLVGGQWGRGKAEAPGADHAGPAGRGTAGAGGAPLPAGLGRVPGARARHGARRPRLPSAAALAKEKNLDAIIFIGPRAGALANVAEDAELDELERQGLRIVRITDGPDFTDVAGELLDQRLRPRAAQIGLDDGRRAAQQVAALR
ncbi:hypothetical protein Shyhy02_45690 [Streptomyces hygroscopicus subsp. hygroscopicus]|nr:hypothetical protein Shyhy02_45690 [Streptomyces hygroscopicus subsp. hygroscopicus]